MKNQSLVNWQKEVEVLAAFGEAKLVKSDGRLELRGGTMSDRTEALEWVSMFMPDQVVKTSSH